MRTAACLLVLTAGLAWPGHAAAAEDTCFGLAPTLVGTPTQTLTGTDGPDVIVTNDASEVDALAGDDTVCVTGDDHSVIDLGAGSDRLLGNGAGHTVDAGDVDDVAAGQPWGTDTITVGKGYDYVFSGAPGGADANHDVIRMGAGDDTLQAYWPLPDVDAGTDKGDHLYLGYGLGRIDWVIDNRAGTVTTNGITAPSVVGFDVYDLRRLNWASLDFTGGPRGETLYVLGDYPDSDGPGAPRSDGPFTASMGGGRDELFVRSMDTGPFDLGGGKDYFWIANTIRHRDARFVVDLPRGVYGYPRRESGLTGAERLTVISGNSLVIGDDGNNFIKVHGCDPHVYAGGGDDVVVSDFDPYCKGKPLGTTAYGGPGNDRLSGGILIDRLIGGPGRDKAHGSIGKRDVCVAEIEDDCER